MRTASTPGLWINPKRGRAFTVLDAAPELFLGGDYQVLVERIGLSFDLDPLATAGNNRQDGRPGGDHPHIGL